MKRIAALAITVVALFAAANVNAGGSHIWASKMPVRNVPFLDHTYACISGYGCYTTPNSRTSGGQILNDTHGYANGYQAKQYANCTFYYALPRFWGNGVCHQHTNRVMFRTGKTLPMSVKWYRTSKDLWGITGNFGGPLSGRFRRCINSVDG